MQNIYDTLPGRSQLRRKKTIPAIGSLPIKQPVRGKQKREQSAHIQPFVPHVKASTPHPQAGLPEEHDARKLNAFTENPSLDFIIDPVIIELHEAAGRFRGIIKQSKAVSHEVLGEGVDHLNFIADLIPFRAVEAVIE